MRTRAFRLVTRIVGGSLAGVLALWCAAELFFVYGSSRAIAQPDYSGGVSVLRPALFAGALGLLTFTVCWLIVRVTTAQRHLPRAFTLSAVLVLATISVAFAVALVPYLSPSNAVNAVEFVYLGLSAAIVGAVLTPLLGSRWTSQDARRRPAVGRPG